METPKIKCLGCKYADWNKTETGRLSPNGGGWCRWSQSVEIKIPASMYFIGFTGPAKPMGGYIYRKPQKFGNPITECPTFEPIEP